MADHEPRESTPMNDGAPSTPVLEPFAHSQALSLGVELELQLVCLELAR